MEYDENYEIYKFVGKAADEYEPLEELLRRHKLSFDEVLYQVDAFRSRFARLVQQYNILDRNFMTLCISLTETLEELPANEDLQFLYCAMATDCGLLFDLTPEERDDEQDIRCWLEQKRRMEGRTSGIYSPTARIPGTIGAIENIPKKVRKIPVSSGYSGRTGIAFPAVSGTWIFVQRQKKQYLSGEYRRAGAASEQQ